MIENIQQNFYLIFEKRINYIIKILENKNSKILCTYVSFSRLITRNTIKLKNNIIIVYSIYSGNLFVFKVRQSYRLAGLIEGDDVSTYT